MSYNKVFPQPTLQTVFELFAAMAMQGVLDCKLCGLCDALVRGAA